VHNQLYAEAQVEWENLQVAGNDSDKTNAFGN
jgi:hypothetical protein